MFAASKAPNLSWLVQGGLQYWEFPFSNDSLVKVVAYKNGIHYSTSLSGQVPCIARKYMSRAKWLLLTNNLAYYYTKLFTVGKSLTMTISSLLRFLCHWPFVKRPLALIFIQVRYFQVTRSHPTEWSNLWCTTWFLIRVNFTRWQGLMPNLT